MDELQLFRGQDYTVNEALTIHHPTLEEICNIGERAYYQAVYTLCATPSDYKVFLYDELHIDWESVSELEFFPVLCRGVPLEISRFLFGEVRLEALYPETNPQNGECILRCPGSALVLDSALLSRITGYLRKLHGLEKHVDTAGNAHTRKYLLDKERRALQRRGRDKAQPSILLPLISSMVNCEQFKYNHETVWRLPLYPFMDSVRRIQKLKSYNQIMQGVYSGTVDAKKLAPETLYWMGTLE